MPLQATSGAASYDAFGGGVPAVTNYIEDVFSTYLYDPTGDPLTITNGIDLSGKGGLVWLKNRTVSANHYLYDTARGATSGNAKYIVSNSSAAQSSGWPNSLAVTNSGFTLGSQAATPGEINNFGYPVVSWTFRKQPKFFDVVTYTGNGSNPRQIAHNLGSAPGFIAGKKTSGSGDWFCYHRSLGATKYLSLNLTDGEYTSSTFWGNTTPTSTEFTVSSNSNNSGDTYIAYLFAHDAGGFGLTGTDNVISCGSYTGNAGTQSITLGYEPQWIMVKNTNAGEVSGNWHMFDVMRGMPVPISAGNNQDLLANTSAAETGGFRFFPTSTGFRLLTETDGEVNASGQTYIYIAIRRGPMKVPTSGTSVFKPVLQNGGGTVSTGFPADFVLATTTSFNTEFNIQDRLRGAFRNLSTITTAAEADYSPQGYNLNLSNTSFLDNYNDASYSTIYENFRRAPSFFDEVCYTGTGSNTTQTHNLGVIPELMIVKQRNASAAWIVYSSALLSTQFIVLNQTAAKQTGATRWNSTRPTSSVFSIGTSGDVNTSGNTYVAYLFATCAGVSKVFSYTGNGSSQTINCGFSGGARFVLIKRTDSTGDWFVWDTARGIVSGNDPHLSLNTTASEVTSDDTIDTDSTGFVVNQVSATDVNVSSATYIGLAIA